MKLTLHIGLGKTGTTSLQQFMANNPSAMARAGITYAGLGLKKLNTGFSFQQQGHVNDPKRLRQGVEALATAAREVRIDQRKHIFWSNETLGMGFQKTEIAPALLKMLAETGAFDEVEIIMVLRRQDDWIESAYRQWGLKHKTYEGTTTISPGQYLESVSKLLDYEALYRSWAVFGTKSVKVVSYDEVKAAGGIVAYFCDHLGIAYDPKFDSDAPKNTSYGAAQSYFFSVYNRGFERPVRGKEFKPMLDSYDLPELADPDCGFYDTAARKAVLQRYEHSNAELADRLGRDTLFSDRPVRETRLYTEAEATQHMLTYLAMIARQQHDQLGSNAPKDAEEDLPKRTPFGNILRGRKG